MSEMQFGAISEPEESAFHKPSTIDSQHPLAVAFNKSDERGGTEVHVQTDTPAKVVAFLRKYAKQENRGVRVKVTDDGVVFKATEKRASKATTEE